MPQWAWGLIISGALGVGGLIGYWLRGYLDEHFAQRREARQFKQGDIRALRDELYVFLGEPKSHFLWLKEVQDVRKAGGSPSPEAKAAMIGDWVYKNASRFPRDRRGEMYLILNVAYQLARGDRHFIDANPRGYEALEEAWDTLDEYAQELTRQLHGSQK